MESTHRGTTTFLDIIKSKYISNIIFAFRRELDERVLLIQARLSTCDLIATYTPSHHWLKKHNKSRILEEKITTTCLLSYLNSCIETKLFTLDTFIYLLKCVERNKGDNLGMVFDRAASLGYLDVVIYLNENTTYSCTSNAIDNAARNGHLPIVQYLLMNRSEGYLNAIEYAAISGHSDIFQYLVKVHKGEIHCIHENVIRRGCSSQYPINEVAHFNHTQIVKWLVEWLDAPCSYQAIESASKNGNMELLLYLFEHRRKQIDIPNGLSSSAIELASANGHLSVVKLLTEKYQYKCTTKAIDKAAERGHDEILLYLSSNRTEGCTTDAMDKAAENGYISIVKYLSENRTEGCSTNAMDKAAMNGHLDIVRYMTEERHSKCTKSAMDLAASRGNLEMVKYLHDKRTEGCTRDAIRESSMNGHLDVVRFLTENRKENTNPTAMDLAAKNGHYQIVVYLSENRTEKCTSRAMAMAVENNHLNVVQYLAENRTEGNIEDAIRLSLRKEYTEMARYLIEFKTKHNITIPSDSLFIVSSHISVQELQYYHDTGVLSEQIRRILSITNLGYNGMKFMVENNYISLNDLGYKIYIDKEFTVAASNGDLETVKYLISHVTRLTLTSTKKSVWINARAIIYWFIDRYQQLNSLS